MKICIITIGQSPRKDFEESIDKYLRNTEVIQVGALDNIDNDFPKPKTNNILVSRLRSGEEVKVDKEVLVNKIQEIIDTQDNSKIDLILIACTGEFSEFNSATPIVYPDKLVCDVLNNLLNEHTEIGVLVPDEKQKNYINEKWQKYNFKTTNFYISPYQHSEEEVNQLAKEINKKKLKYIICDCIGYNEKFKQRLLNLTDKNIILSKDIVFSNLNIF